MALARFAKEMDLELLDFDVRTQTLLQADLPGLTG